MVHTKTQSLKSSLAQLNIRTGYVSLETTGNILRLLIVCDFFFFKETSALYAIKMCHNNNKKPHQSCFTQTRKVLFNCREELSAFLSTEPTGKENKYSRYHIPVEVALFKEACQTL